MNVSYNWLKEYLDVDMPWQKISEILTDIGLEVEGEKEIGGLPNGLQGLVVGEVTSCSQHPNADRLSVTTVNIGEPEDLPIVCGAPNVAAGQKVVIATIGTMLYPTEGEPFKIKKGKIRGEVSAGMICAEDEIGIGTSHDGIMVLPEDTPVGMPASALFDNDKDIVFDIGLTPNRSDATGHLGVAEDLAAALKINYGHSGEVKRPDVSAFKVDNQNLPIAVQVCDTALCARYCGVSIQGVTVKESPEWLKKRLAAVGVTPKNNIVDITNFVLLELGQPLHAFDADAITGNKVIVQCLPEAPPFTTLDGEERKLDGQDLMICDGNGKGMCIAGVFGGMGSGVKESTTNIFLESAHFHPVSIRKSSRRHLLFTDAAKCYEKGTDPNVCRYALQRAALLIRELAGGEVASEIADVYPAPLAKAEVVVKYSHVNRLIGDELTKEQTKAILSALSIEILKEGGDELLVAIPTNKVDVTREADVIEEILRIYGVNKVGTPAGIRSVLTPGEAIDPFRIRNVVADMLAAQGFNEMMGLSITESRYFKDLYPVEDGGLVYINNTANMHLDVMRPTMLFSGLEAILRNQNRRASDLRLFEFGKTYLKDGDDYVETPQLTLFLTGQRHEENWLNRDKAQVTFYSMKAHVNGIMRRLGLQGFQESPTEDALFAYGTKYHRGPNTLVDFGQVKGGITKGLSIKSPVFYAVFQWDAVLKALRKHKIEFQALNKFPTMRRDLALVLDQSKTFGEVLAIAKKTGKKLLRSVNLFDVFEDTEKLGEGKKSYAISMIFEDPSKTLKDKDVDKVVKQMTQQFEQRLGANIRQ